MQRLTLDARMGQSVEIDYCAPCRAFWFDEYESLHLTPAATLQLFRMIADITKGGAAGGRLGEGASCPRCGGKLQLAHDKQRNTPFQYWRCVQGHGRFIGFTEFLKEKNFIQPLSPAQIEELRRNVRAINCSNCGAPVVLATESACRHCGSALVMIDMQKVAEVAERYQKATGRELAPHPRPPLRQPSSADSVTAGGVVEAGIEIVGELISWILW